MLLKDLIVRAGTLTDCKKVVEQFTQAASSENELHFSLFAQQWQLMNFDLIFHGHESIEELTLFTSELLDIAKNIALIKGDFAEQVGGLYLMYSLYYRQNTRVKISLSPKEVKQVCVLLEDIKTKQNQQAEYTLWKLFVDQAFSYTATAGDFIYLKRFMVDEEETKKTKPSVNPSLLIQCHGLSSRNLNEIQEIHRKYDEIKKKFPELNRQLSERSAINNNFVNELCDKIKSFHGSIGQKDYEDPRDADDIGLRRKRLREEAMASTVTRPFT